MSFLSRCALCFCAFGVFVVTASAQNFPNGFRPFLITLDHNDDFVLSGDGQSLTGIDFQHFSGGLELTTGSFEVQVEEQLITGEAPAPFNLLLANDPNQVTLVALPGQQVTVNGSYSLGFGPTDPSDLEDLFIQVGDGPTPVENPLNFVCETCVFPNLQLTPGGGIELTNVNELIINLTLFSPDGFTVTQQLPPGVSVIDSTETSVTLENPEGFAPERLRNLDFGFASSSGNVFAEFTLANDVTFGPFPIAAAAVPEPSAGSLAIAALVCCGLFRRVRRTR